MVFPRNQERLERFRSLLGEKKRGETPFDVARRACRTLSEEFVAHREEYLAQQRLVASTPSLLAYERELDRRRRARVMAAAAMGAIRATLREWCTRGGRGDLLDMADEAMDLLEFGALSVLRPNHDERKAS